ncbi:hypothetical protein SAMN06265365_11082 [Tistlia consotensis]|uniref:Uncharacterized protein n=1 Tax=Tistlia consotensis USBA 355 TaxID=560819 RepID=A0A1Y6BU08_9PROT|nr:hypothetical protein [Tistlia consotensis]SMF27294.1 hypothetical protein SAMN05428998_10974 [Tistlia consotensis USBA 355]SNR66280.1 hypothetical protein SAMN06265365_11082 [Tistlia consotensis]
MQTSNVGGTMRLSELDGRGLARAVVASLLSPVAIDSERPGDGLLMLTAVPGFSAGGADPATYRSSGAEASAEDLGALFERVRGGEDVVVQAGSFAACLTRGPSRADPVALEEWLTDYWMGATAG